MNAGRIGHACRNNAYHGWPRTKGRAPLPTSPEPAEYAGSTPIRVWIQQDGARLPVTVAEPEAGGD